MADLTISIPPEIDEEGSASFRGVDTPGERREAPADDAAAVSGVPPTPQRTQAVFVRSETEVKAMNGLSRLKVQIRSFVKHILCCQTTETTTEMLKHQNDDDPEQGGDGHRLEDDGRPKQYHLDFHGRAHSHNRDFGKYAAKQYRLEATSHGPSAGVLQSVCSCFMTANSGATNLLIGDNPNQRLAIYLHWVFRVNFIFLFIAMCVTFFVLITVFAGFIMAAGRLDSQCVLIGGSEFNHAGSAFADAFGLSWTTFSTVGYGSSYPSLGHENDNPSNCLLITVVCSLESFLGVLYSGFCGAILFGKVLRIQSHAQVIFSDPIVVRYGPGVMLEDEYLDSDDNTDNDKNIDETGNEADDDKSGDSSSSQKLPCPVLEFRVVNRLYGEIGGEIMDATLNVVANVDANDADPYTLEALDPHKINSLDGRTSSTRQSSDGGSASEYSDSNRTWNSSEGVSPPQLLSRLGPLGAVLPRKRDHQAVVEDPSARLVSKRIFSKMIIEPSDHPFFKRVWLARHTLNDSSPILKPKVRRMIRRNGGFWPSELNSHQAVRDSMQFNQILVSLNGVSNVSASDVYAQKIYDFVDINIGYQFVNILYRESDGSLKVDTDLINDVREQKGGGGEPLLV